MKCAAPSDTPMFTRRLLWQVAALSGLRTLAMAAECTTGASFTLAEKTAIVTGASGAIGSAIAQQLYDKGMNVVLVGRREAALKATADAIAASSTPEGSRSNALLPVACDVTSEAEVQGLFQHVATSLGSCDLVVNNAGVAFGGSLLGLDVADYKKTMDVNVLGPLLLSKEAFKLMIPQGGGRIINVGSISSMSPRPNSVSYATSKFAVTGLTKSLALDGRKHGIAVGVIHPGNVISDLLTPEQIAKRQEEEGFVSAEDVAASVVHMASLPYTANVLEMTVMPTSQPLVGRG